MFKVALYKINLGGRFREEIRVYIMEERIMLNLKVGVMPGRLVEVTVEEGTSARDIFEIAGVSVSNHEVRLDGDKIDMDSYVEDGKLLVAMKQIKGNARTIKTGTMPGRLKEVQYTEGQTAREILEANGINYSGYDIRLNGDKITEDTPITSGSLLVTLKQIKGNREIWVSEYSEGEIEVLLGFKLPTTIPNESVETIADSLVVINDEVIIETQNFLSVYKLQEETGEVEHVCTCDKNAEAKEIIEIELNKLNESYEDYKKLIDEVIGKMVLLESIAKRL